MDGVGPKHDRVASITVSDFLRTPPPRVQANVDPPVRPSLPRDVAPASTLAALPRPSTRAMGALALSRPLKAEPEGAYLRYIARLRAALVREGLPTHAPHARVYVSGEVPPEIEGPGAHGRVVSQLIAGEHGLARGAELHFIREPETPDERAWSDVAHRGVRVALEALQRRRLEIERLMAVVPDDGRVSLVNMSWGISRAGLVERYAAGDLASAPEDLQQLIAEHAMTLPHAPADMVKTQAAVRWVDAGFRDHHALIERETQLLAAAVQRARDRNILVFAAAGNAGDVAASLRDTERELGFGTGIVFVAATDLNDPDVDHDDALASFSGAGVIAAPGVELPSESVPDSGTSFATPVTVGAVGLMVEANPSLTAHDLARLITEPGALTNAIDHDVRDGGGAIDPVRAVRLARQLSTGARHAISPAEPELSVEETKRSLDEHDSLRQVRFVR